MTVGKPPQGCACIPRCSCVLVPLPECRCKYSCCCAPGVLAVLFDSGQPVVVDVRDDLLLSGVILSAEASGVRRTMSETSDGHVVVWMSPAVDSWGHVNETARSTANLLGCGVVSLRGPVLLAGWDPVDMCSQSLPADVLSAVGLSDVVASGLSEVTARAALMRRWFESQEVPCDDLPDRLMAVLYDVRDAMQGDPPLFASDMRAIGLLLSEGM